MITLDASTLIAHLHPQDPHHQAATDLIRTHAPDGFLMHSLNLAEVLVGGARIGRGEQMLADIEAIGVAVARPPEGETLRLAHLRASTGLKLPDCCALDTALNAGTTLATCDDGLANAARHRHVTVAPDR